MEKKGGPDKGGGNARDTCSIDPGEAEPNLSGKRALFELSVATVWVILIKQIFLNVGLFSAVNKCSQMNGEIEVLQ